MDSITSFVVAPLVVPNGTPPNVRTALTQIQNELQESGGGRSSGINLQTCISFWQIQAEWAAANIAECQSRMQGSSGQIGKETQTARG
jgi:hypothetical protein